MPLWIAVWMALILNFGIRAQDSVQKMRILGLDTHRLTEENLVQNRGILDFDLCFEISPSTWKPQTPQQVSLVLKKQDWNTVQRKWIDFDQTSLQSTWIVLFPRTGLKDELWLGLKESLVHAPEFLRAEDVLGWMAYGSNFSNTRLLSPKKVREITPLWARKIQSLKSISKDFSSQPILGLRQAIQWLKQSQTALREIVIFSNGKTWSMLDNNLFEFLNQEAQKHHIDILMIDLSGLDQVQPSPLWQRWLQSHLSHAPKEIYAWHAIFKKRYQNIQCIRWFVDLRKGWIPSQSYEVILRIQSPRKTLLARTVMHWPRMDPKALKRIVYPNRDSSSIPEPPSKPKPTQNCHCHSTRYSSHVPPGWSWVLGSLGFILMRRVLKWQSKHF